jgi:hypothetical protein
VAANSAAREIRTEIDRRLQMLEHRAEEKSLQDAMVRINNVPSQDALWAPLREWIGARKSEGDQIASAESWFINDRRGVQVARSPNSDTVGNSFAHRDYFHGQGLDLKEGTTGLTPITQPHLSAVYRSTSTDRLKVAFSVPIDNGRSGPARAIIGVLAMSVDLGEFNVLENVLDRRRASIPSCWPGSRPFSRPSITRNRTATSC